MGNCVHSTHEDLQVERYEHLSLLGPRLYHDNDSYLCRFVAAESSFHERLMQLVEDEGCDAARFPGNILAPRDELATRRIVRGCPPFSLLYDHLLEFGLTPQVVIEEDPSAPIRFHVIALSTKEQFNWISLFMHDPQQTRDMVQVCDLTLSNMGRMMIIRPPLFRFSSRGSLSSTHCQHGSLDNIPLFWANQAPKDLLPADLPELVHNI